MTARAQHRSMMKAARAAGVEALIREIRRYLAYVDGFRSPPPERPTNDKGGRNDA